MNIRSTALLLAALFAVGCAETRSYSISVKNATSGPLTIGQVKRGGPFEDLWATPKDVAVRVPASKERAWGVTLPAGKTAHAGPLTGKFNSGASAWMLVFRGDPSLNEILATSSGNPNRLNLPLDPGPNDFVVTESNGRLTAERLNPVSPAFERH